MNLDEMSDEQLLSYIESDDRTPTQRQVALSEAQARWVRRGKPRGDAMASNVAKQEVEITDIRMRFGSMVVFMVKWALASIPALIILTVLLIGVWAVAMGLLASLFHR